MRELVLTLHGIGTPHPLVEADERRYWWSQNALARLLDGLGDEKASGNIRVSLTFDDGNDSDATLVLPELHKRGLKASFFVCAGRIGKPHYLDRAMIADLLAAGMTVGSHGMHHVDWRNLSPAALDVEIGEARRILEDVAGAPITTLSIPFGSYNRRVLNCLKSERFECIYTSDRGTTRTDTKFKPRETLSEDMQTDHDIVVRLTKPAPSWVAMRRAVAGVYKRTR